jgi:hypothetical protein
MPVFVSKGIGVLKIASGQTNGVPIKANEVFEDAVSILVYGRNVTDGVLTYKIQVSPDMDAATPTWYDLEDAAAAVIALPNITGKARHYTPSLNNWWGSATGMRAVSSAVTTADRFWEITKQFLS